jgi:hypothetical protein
MLSDEQLMEIAEKIDSFFIDICKEYNEHPLNITAITLGRLYIAAMAGKCTNEFKSMMQSIIDNQGIDTQNIVKH